eukprot:m.98693 g.98693  ORF g.98693 m.98693 type:complete len:362 (+) comp27089_c1_seq1:177-1262(+)
MGARRRSSVDPVALVGLLGRMPVAKFVDADKPLASKSSEPGAELPMNTLEANRAEGYQSVLKTGSIARPTLSVGFLLIVVSFLATPQGLHCFFISIGFCTGFMSKEFVLAQPLIALLRGTVLTSIWSICTFLPLARYWDQLYVDNPGLRCQPNIDYNNVTSKLLERAEVKLAMLSLIVAAAVTNCIGVYGVVYPDGLLKVYVDTPASLWDCAWLVISAAWYFVWIDGWAYFAHRILHFPLIYKHIHKVHHIWKQPTAFVALALHPLEMLWLYGGVYAGMFVIPMHPAVLTLNLLYIHFFNVVDHSGVYAESWIPWQPSSLFHDDHHRYFHLNYGQSLTIWDRLGNTFYEEKAKYGERKFSF